MRISTTTIESYRLWSDPEQEWMPESELINTIKGIWAPPEKVLIGIAYGRALEKPDKYRTNLGYRVPVHDGNAWRVWLFRPEVVEAGLEEVSRDGVFEVKTQKEYAGHIVVSKADRICGTIIDENKTTLSSFDFDKYSASCQWRFMADSFGASMVRYHVFLLHEDDKGEISLRGIESFNLYPYAKMHYDCLDLVNEFADYVKSRGLEGYLVEKQYA